MANPTNVSARAPEETMARLEAQAERLGVKKSELIRLALASGVLTLENEGLAELTDDAGELAGGRKPPLEAD